MAGALTAEQAVASMWWLGLCVSFPGLRRQKCIVPWTRGLRWVLAGLFPSEGCKGESVPCLSLLVCLQPLACSLPSSSRGILRVCVSIWVQIPSFPQFTTNSPTVILA